MRRVPASGGEDEEGDQVYGVDGCCFSVVFPEDGRSENVDFSKETWRFKKQGQRNTRQSERLLRARRSSSCAAINSLNESIAQMKISMQLEEKVSISKDSDMEEEKKKGEESRVGKPNSQPARKHSKKVHGSSS